VGGGGGGGGLRGGGGGGGGHPFSLGRTFPVDTRGCPIPYQSLSAFELAPLKQDGPIPRHFLRTTVDRIVKTTQPPAPWRIRVEAGLEPLSTGPALMSHSKTTPNTERLGHAPATTNEFKRVRDPFAAFMYIVTHRLIAGRSPGGGGGGFFSPPPYHLL